MDDVQHIISSSASQIIDSRYATYYDNITDWEKWRLTYRGGDLYRQRYLEKYPEESADEFAIRKRLTPIPAFAKAAIKDIRNALFSRMCDISRVGGSAAYRDAVSGERGGIDRRGKALNSFLGIDILDELLVMGRCGIVVDNSPFVGPTLADANHTQYLYMYQVEDILSYAYAEPESPSEFQSVLLRDTCVEYDPITRLPLNTFKRFRLMWLDNGLVQHQFYNAKGEGVDRMGNPAGPVTLELERIPFVLADIGDSLLRDAAEIQIALLNNFSRAVNYDRLSNAAFLTMQTAKSAGGGHLKPAGEDGTSTSTGDARERRVEIGSGHGLAYPYDTERPGFIHPSPEPILASFRLKEILEQDIRKSVNLAVQTLATRESAESKALDNQGLEDGLSFIGFILESVERSIAELWAGYEHRVPRRRDVAKIKYPDRYSLKSDQQRIEEAKELAELLYSVPSRAAKKELFKQIVSVLLGGRIKVDRLREIHEEIDSSDYLTSDPNTIIAAFEQGLIDAETGAMALGFKSGVAKKAQDEKVERVRRESEAQAAGRPEPTPIDPPNTRGNNKDNRAGERNAKIPTRV